MVLPVGPRACLPSPADLCGDEPFTLGGRLFVCEWQREPGWGDGWECGCNDQRCCCWGDDDGQCCGRTFEWAEGQTAVWVSNRVTGESRRLPLCFDELYRNEQLRRGVVNPGLSFGYSVDPREIGVGPGGRIDVWVSTVNGDWGPPDPGVDDCYQHFEVQLDGQGSGCAPEAPSRGLCQ